MDICAGLCCILPVAFFIIITVLAVIGSMRDSAAWDKAKKGAKNYPETSYIYKKSKTKYIVKVEDVSDGKL